jgi:putative alpha-1,2-mannosidase
VFGTPIFDKVSVDLGAGKQFVIEAQRSSSSAKYIQDIHLNGKSYEKIWFTHRDLVAGARFTLKMGAEPNSDFGSAPNLAPPSASS